MFEICLFLQINHKITSFSANYLNRSYTNLVSSLLQKKNSNFEFKELFRRTIHTVCVTHTQINNQSNYRSKIYIGKLL